MDGIAALKLIRDIGYANIAELDGCHCSACSIKGVEIDVSCRTANGGGAEIFPEFHGTMVRVYSHSLDSDDEACKDIANEVAGQICKDEPSMIRICSAENDMKNACAYCGGQRENRQAVYCNKHTKSDARGF